LDSVRELMSEILSAGVRLKFGSGQYGWTDYTIKHSGYMVVIDDEENLKILTDSGEKIAGYNPERSVCNWNGNERDLEELKKLLEVLRK
jgi:hypothetical protein